MTIKLTFGKWLALISQARTAQQLSDRGRHQDARNIMVNNNLKGWV